jgi:hypothetical protein
MYSDACQMQVGGDDGIMILTKQQFIGIETELCCVNYGPICYLK